MQTDLTRHNLVGGCAMVLRALETEREREREGGREQGEG